jgi:hypothetical protein
LVWEALKFFDQILAAAGSGSLRSTVLGISEIKVIKLEDTFLQSFMRYTFPAP